jgi:hypothetical protein
MRVQSSSQGLRMSPTNFVYNHIGHFAAAGRGVAKAIFPGGVTRRFADLNFAFLANIVRESYDGKRGWRHFESSFFITRTTPGNLFWQSGTTYILPILRPPWFRPGLYLEIWSPLSREAVVG